MARIAINGFGRIGRASFRVGWGRPEFMVVAINDLASADQLAYLLTHDTNYGRWPVPVSSDGSNLIVGGHTIPVLKEKDPAALPWGKLNIDAVIESSGFFTTESSASAHLKAGAHRVILSAPAKEGDIPTFVRGVNCSSLKGDSHPIISNASCTTNCAAAVTAVVEETFGISKALLSTVHGYTASQALVDSPRPDWREGRAAAENIVPTTTGAAKTVTKTIPSLAGHFDGLSIRVPLSTVSLCDLVFVLKQKTTVDQINAAFISATSTPRWSGILGTSTEPLVSSDYKGDPRSAIVDLSLTKVIDGDLAKVVAWYDNEWGYANRLVELTLMASGHVI